MRKFSSLHTNYILYGFGVQLFWILAALICGFRLANTDMEMLVKLE